MGAVGTVKRIEGETYYVDLGAGDVVRAQVFGAPGDESTPVVGDYVAVLGVGGQGDYAIVASSPASALGGGIEGAKQIFARDSGGYVTATVTLNGDGTVAIEGAGSVTINGHLEVKA